MAADTFEQMNTAGMAERTANTTAVQMGRLHVRTLSTDTFYKDDYFHISLFQIAVPVLFAFIVLMGVAGNLLVIYVILSRSHLRTVTNLLLISLAVADVSFLLICGSFTAVHYALTTWPFGDPLCRVIQYFLYVTAYITVYTLVAVSFARYIHVVFGPRTSFLKKKTSVVILILLIWLVFLLCKIPILIVHGVTYDSVNQRSECIISGKTEGKQLFASFFVFAYALPLFIICTLYILLICHVRKRRSDMLHTATVNRRNHHVTRVVAIVVVVFAVCWLPIHIHLLIAYYGTPPVNPYYKILLLFFHSLTFLNSALNPFIYNVFSSDFRRVFREVMWCKASEPPEVSV